MDIDGDGLMDIVTGKRFWAHGKNGPDPDSNGAAVLYWFQLVRPAKGQAEYIPHLIDDDSGVGTQVTGGIRQQSQIPRHRRRQQEGRLRLQTPGEGSPPRGMGKGAAEAACRGWAQT